MDNSYTGSIDIERVSDSLNKISTVDSGLNNIDLTPEFLEIEDYLKKANLEHGNFDNSYIETIDNVLSEISGIKKDINKLNTSLETTVKDFKEADEIDKKEVQKISKIYGNKSMDQVNETLEQDMTIKLTKNKNNMYTDYISNIKENIQLRKSQIATDVQSTDIPEYTFNESNVTTIEPPKTNEGAEENAVTINTVPVGLGIAAAGIAGSVGAVVVDSLKGNDKKDTLESYHPEQVEVVENKPGIVFEPDNMDDSDYYDREIADVGPYHANKNRESQTIYYDEELPTHDEDE